MSPALPKEASGDPPIRQALHNVNSSASSDASIVLPLNWDDTVTPSGASFSFPMFYTMRAPLPRQPHTPPK